MKMGPTEELAELTATLGKSARRAKVLLSRLYPVGTVVEFREFGKTVLRGSVAGYGFDQRTAEPRLLVRYKDHGNPAWANMEHMARVKVSHVAAVPPPN